MRQMLSVAVNTFRESARSRVLLTIGLLALLMIISSLLLGALSFGEERKIVADWGLFCISVFGVAITVAVGIQLIHKEVDRKTLYAVLAKPVGRTTFLLGKHLGTVAVLVVAVLAMALVHQGLMIYASGGLEPRLLLGALAILLMLLLLAAVATFFSTVSSPLLSGLFTLALFLAGRSLHSMKYLIFKLEHVYDMAGTAAPLKVLYYLLPNFAVFDIDGEVVHGLALPEGYLGLLALYAVAYSAVLLAAAALAFARRDLS
jgi:ABC-type transport system involved in multi-copper enzyme maturation permease subunit